LFCIVSWKRKNREREREIEKWIKKKCVAV
jgi:hypothetical protein